MLPGHKPNPSRQATSGRERLPIPDFGNQCSGNDRANARDFLEPSAFFARSMPAMDMLLDGSDLCRDICVLASKSLEAQPRGNWNAIVPRISKNLKQLGRTITAFRRDDAKLSQMPADRIRQHRSLTDQKLPTAMQHQSRLLLFRFGRHKTHRWSRHRLADGGRIIGVIFVALETSLHVARVASVLRCGRAPEARGSNDVRSDTPLFRLRQDGSAAKNSKIFARLMRLADHNRAINVHAMYLKYRLRDIETNRANLAHGRLPS
jgi:hypothetical protein